MRAIVACAKSFDAFLDYWKFLDQRTGKQGSMDGAGRWSGQEKFIAAMGEHSHIYGLKARKLGFTTLEVAYDAWVLRFRDENARVHLFSRRDDAAIELLDAVKYGLARLPAWMQLPVIRSTSHELVLYAEDNDERLVKAYPAGKETAVESTCGHGHVDEWARMVDPESVWQAIEPTMAGSCHIITTGIGPESFTAQFWRRCLSGDTQFHPFFTSALERYDRDEEWLLDRKRSMTEKAFRQEFPLTWADALFGGGEFTFEPEDIRACGAGPGESDAQDGHTYVKSWDIGRHTDAAVCVVIDKATHDIVHYERHREKPYPFLQQAIERVHDLYPGKTVVEENSAGLAVIENCDIRPHEIEGFKTTGQSKPKIIACLEHALEHRTFTFNAVQWPQIEAELLGYQIPDKAVIQDSVMSLAIGLYQCNAKSGRGKMRRVIMA